MKVNIREHVVSEVADGEVVLLDLARGVYYALDPIGSRFWGLLQRGDDLETARAHLLREYQVTEEQLMSDLDQLLSELASRGLIELGAS